MGGLGFAGSSKNRACLKIEMNYSQIMTDFKSICGILSEIRNLNIDEGLWDEFCQFNDIGVPLAHLVAQDLATPTDAGIEMIMGTWDLLMKGLETEDDGFKNLNELLAWVE
jgi:hypothetical protein